MLHVEERILVSEVAKLKKEKEEAQAKSAQREYAAATPTQAGADSLQAAESIDAEPSSTASTAEDEAYHAALAAGYETVPSPTELQAEFADRGEEQSSFPTAQLSSLNPLYPKERLIVQQLIRHGEKVMFVDEESKQEISVAEYVASELGMDNITLTTPLFAEVLQELLLTLLLQKQ